MLGVCLVSERLFEVFWCDSGLIADPLSAVDIEVEYIF